MKSKNVFCLLDARFNPERTFFQKSAIRNSLAHEKAQVKFAILLDRKSDSVYADSKDIILLSEDYSSFGHILEFLINRRETSTHFVLAENDVYLDKLLLSQIKEKQIFLPRRTLILGKNGELFCQSNKADLADWDWLSPVMFFYCLKSSALNVKPSDFKNNLTGSLRESFAQLFRTLKLVPLPLGESFLFSFTHTDSYEEIFQTKLNEKTSYFSGPSKPRKKFDWTLQRILSNRQIKESFQQTVTSPALLKALKANAAFDPRWRQLRNTTPKIASVEIHNDLYEEVYRKFCSTLKSCQYVVVAHQLRRGGAEKEAILHLRSYCERYPDNKVGLILTSPIEVDLEWQLPKQVNVIELGKFTAPYFNFNDMSYFLYRILDQVQPSVVHVKGSQFMWGALERFAPQLSKKSRLIANLYCIDFKQSGRSHSPAFRELVKCAPYISKFLTDNQKLLNEIKSLQQIPVAQKVFYPVETPKYTWTTPQESRLKILWCSRLTFQKDVRTLIFIASLFPEHEFHVFGEQSGDGNYLEQFEKLSNVKIWGVFDGIDDIQLNQYHCFLYTSFWDGLPNMVLEVGSHGMPVISPKVGGIEEILNSENSYLYENEKQLVQIFQKWNQDEAQKKSKQLANDIKRVHSWKRFHTACEELYE